MNLERLANDARLASSIWGLSGPALTEMNALYQLYRQQYELMVASKVSHPGAVAFKSWMISTDGGLNSGYIWTSACPIITSLIVNRLKAEASNKIKEAANIRAAMVGLSYRHIADTIESAANLAGQTQIQKEDRVCTEAERIKARESTKTSKEIQAHKERAARAEERQRAAEKELEKLKQEMRSKRSTSIPTYTQPSYTPRRTVVDPCSGSNGLGGSSGHC